MTQDQTGTRDQTLLVTGGSRGIGAAIARLAAERGYDVCLTYQRDAAAAKEVTAAVEAQGRKALAVQADAQDAAATARAFDAVEEALAPLAVVVNNAGITGPIGRLAEASVETLAAVSATNVAGAFFVARETVRRLSTARGGPGGSLINISSRAATLGSAGEYVWYAATKGAIDTLTYGLAQEVSGEGLRVNAVAPGLIETEIHARAGRPDRLASVAGKVPMQRAGLPEEVARAVLWLASEEAAYVSGAILGVSGGR